MSLSQQFQTDSNKEKGVDITFAPNADKSVPTFNICRMGRSNKRYTKMLDHETKPYRRQIELGTIADAVAEKIYMKVFIATILNGWQNVMMSDVTGNKEDTGFAPFTKENAEALFTRLPELYEELQNQSKNTSLFREEALEEEAKN